MAGTMPRMVFVIVPALLAAAFVAGWRYSTVLRRLAFRVAAPHPSGPTPLGYRELLVPCAGGSLPAWRSAEPGACWVIGVHGKGAALGEVIPPLDAARVAGWTALSISYRNDDGVPRRPAATYAYGRAEWPDLEAAVAYARSEGAERIVLCGFSMGGAIALSFLGRSPLARHVAGTILDSPMLDLRATIRHVSTLARTPRPVVEVGLAVAAVRFRLRWPEFNYARSARSLRISVLLIHGSGDSSVPVRLSDRFARELGPNVTFWRPYDVEHVRASQADPERYAAEVQGFLAVVGASATPASTIR